MITQQPYYIIEGNRYTDEGYSVLVLRDKHWEGFDREDIKAVFDYSCAQLQEKINLFHNLSRESSPAEEKELVFLLETLVKSRKLLDAHDESTSL